MDENRKLTEEELKAAETFLLECKKKFFELKESGKLQSATSPLVRETIVTPQKLRKEN